MAGRDNLVEAKLEGYAPEVGAALWRLEDARKRTLRLLAGVPSEVVDAEVNQNSIGTILYHVALIEADWLSTEILERPISDEIRGLLPADDRDAEGVLTAVRGQGLEQHVARLHSIRSNLLDELRGMTTDDFHRERDLPDYSVSPAWVLHHLAQHEAEHRGEMGGILAATRT